MTLLLEEGDGDHLEIGEGAWVCQRRDESSPHHVEEEWEVLCFFFCGGGSKLLCNVEEFFGADSGLSSNKDPDGPDPPGGGG